MNRKNLECVFVADARLEETDAGGETQSGEVAGETAASALRLQDQAK